MVCTGANPRRAFVFYLFSRLVRSAVIVRKPAATESGLVGFVPIPSASAFASESVLPLADGSIDSNLAVTPHPSNNITVMAASVGIGIGGAIVLTIWFLLYVRDRQRAIMRKRTAISTVQRSESPEEICNPLDSESEVNRESYIDRLQTQETGLTPSNTVSTRQHYISNQVDRARRELAELEEVSTLLRSSTVSSRGSSTRLASGIEHDAPNLAAEEEPVDNTTDPEASWVKDRLEDAIRQIEGLNDRIRELEMQRRSSWALGLSDEPPPGYTE
ncbi:hypothetical protein B0H13DRAFT_2395474 [Mycena leptocephala]|nr:hypothetical protein B0H13DRAFT_2395474 [Mycena leptocephala]